MNNLKKSFNKNKKTGFSLIVALIMMLTFNYAPLTLVADRFRNAAAYKATSTQSYYSTSSTTSETNVGAAQYPSALKDYFQGSSNSFNIETYYNTRFQDIFAEKVNEFLITPSTGAWVSNVTETYATSLKSFLDYRNYETLREYYDANSTSINNSYDCTSFMTFVEKFVTRKTEYNTTSTSTNTVPALFTDLTFNNNRSEFYCYLANYILKQDKTVETINDKIDNVASDASDSDFYRDSYSYERMKDAIDDIIVETVAIYSYDSVTQNNIVGSIIAQNAPTFSSFYYKDNSFEVGETPNYTFETKTLTVSGVSVTKNTIYYFGATADISATETYLSLKDYFIIEKQSTFDSNLFLYKKIAYGETGYIDENHPTYHKYTSIPFVRTNERYSVYVVDNNVTPSEKATYDALRFTAVSRDDIEADKNGFYSLLPYSEANTRYFQEVSGITPSDEATTKLFKRFCDLFAPTENANRSILYLRYNDNTAYNVYIDPAENIVEGTGIDAEEFMKKFPTYKYNVETVTITEANKNDFFKVTSSYSSYYKTGYTLYFQKVKVDYTTFVEDNYETDIEGDPVYETKETPNIPYETTEIPSKSFEIDVNGRVIYALTDGSAFLSYKTVTQETLDNEANRNVYVEVPESVYIKVYGTNERTNKLYFKHELETTNKIYIVADKDEKNPKDNEVYKNLYYSVLTTSEYEEQVENFNAIPTTDPNYNENFKLYYRYDKDLENDDIYLQNELSQNNAIYIVDDSLSSTEIGIYKHNMYTVIKTSEYKNASEFYFKIPKGDVNYSDLYTLYYKYNANPEKERVVYAYSTSSKETYPTFYNTSADYIASDYVLVQPTDTKYYVEGKNLYFKKVRKAEGNETPTVKNTYYYYNSSSSVSLKANSFYMISFYVVTTGENVQASLYLTDKNKAIKDIALENIHTAGEWVKYVAFFSTDSINTSSITLSMYMGNKNSILGSNYTSQNTIKTITGSVLFDNINIHKINETDYNKLAFNDTVVADKEEQKDSVSGDKICDVKVVVANKAESGFDANVFENRTVNLTNSASWADMFNFDNGSLVNEIKNVPEVTTNTDGFSDYTSMWQYYISRNVSGQGNNDKLTQYQNAYINHDLFASVISESSIDKTPINVEEEEETEKDKTEEDEKEDEKEDITDVKEVESTFKTDNYVLKLQNKNRLLSLGLVSNSFIIRQHEYYKLTVWVYSPDQKATATLMVNSILKTSSKPNGSLLSTSANVSANIKGYSTEPTNEYGWVPISFFIEGNALHDQECNLVLMTDKNTTVYFDNITIENISSANYNTASSDSDSTTYVLSLSPTTSVVANGVTNGFFNNITLEADYRNPSTSTPKKAKSWEIEANNSSGVIAGVVPTSKNYTDQDDNFYTKYNNDGSIIHIPYSDGFDATNSYNNVYGIHAPSKIAASIENADENVLYDVSNVYKIYSSSISLKASSVFDISFDFYKGYQFEGKMVANLYAGSMATDKVIASFIIDSESFSSYKWNEFHFYVATAGAAVTAYLEIGIENAKGTVFFKDVSSVTTTKTLNAIRDEALSASDNNQNTDTTLADKTSLSNLKFVDFANAEFSMVDREQNEETNLYKPLDYTIDSLNNVEFTCGEGGTAVSSYFTSTVSYKYSVVINKVTYYIGSVENGDTVSYKLYKYSDLTEEVTEIDNKPVKVENFKKVIVGEGDAAVDNNPITETKVTNYKYFFTNNNVDEYVLNNNIIPAEELTNTYSQNVLLLANSYGTDFNQATSKFTFTLTTTSYYVLRIYVKTSDFESDDIGLNLKVNAIATNWDNINTTKLDADKLDENGFACYQALITTNTSSITNLSITYSIGTTDVTGKGYAIIAGAELEKYATQDEFDHYVSTLDEDDATVKKFFGNNSGSSTSNNDAAEEDEDTLSWSTFFYIFSSLLLGITLVMAIVAVVIKRHPIKIRKKYQNDHEKDSETLIVTKKSKNDKVTDEKELDDNGKDGII